MPEITLDLIFDLLQRIQAEQVAMRADIAGIRSELADLQADMTVLTAMVLRLERNMVQVRDMLGRMDQRIRKLENTD